MRDRTPQIVLSAACLLMVGIVAFAAYLFWINHNPRLDFAVFHSEGRALVTGSRPLYSDVGVRNLNSPALTAWVFAPLSLVSLAAAKVIWLVLTAAAIGVGLMVIARSLRLTLAQGLTVACLLLLMHGSLHPIAIGQVTWPLLFVPVTCAWSAYRAGRLKAAGAWLAPAIVAKPPLALLALMLPVPVWLVAGIGGAALSLMTLPWTGINAWVAWLETGGRVDWLARPSNASAWGFVAKWLTGGYVAVGLHDLPALAIAAVLVSGVAAAWCVIRVRNDADQRFGYAVLWATLFSPLGWNYYLPIIAGPACALWFRSKLIWLAYGLLVIPLGREHHLHPLIGSLYFVSVACAWIAFTRRTTPRHLLK